MQLRGPKCRGEKKNYNRAQSKLDSANNSSRESDFQSRASLSDAVAVTGRCR